MENIFTGIDSNNPIGTISGEIGVDVNPTFFAANLRDITARGVTPKIVINSPGGSVFGGMEIIDAMIDANVNTHIAGMAASMGGIISQFGKHRTANDFSMLMLHSVSGGDKELRATLDNNLKAILKSRTKMPQKMLDTIFKEGKDVWFDASQMLELGLIDEIVSTTVKVNNFNKSLELTNLCAIFNDAVASLGTSETAYTNMRLSNYKENKTNVINMDNDFKEVKSILNLDSSDTERDVLKSIKAKDTTISEHKVEMEIKNEEIEGLKNQISSMNDENATELVNTAKKDGKISDESVKAYVKFAKSDFEGCKAALEGIKAEPVQASVIGGLQANLKPTLSSDEELVKRGYKDIAANSPDILVDLQENKPELLNTLMDNFNKQV